MNRIHQSTVIRTETPTMLKDDAKTFLADSKPCMSATFEEATCPVTSLVTARLIPVSIRNEPNVIRNDGILVFITR